MFPEKSRWPRISLVMHSAEFRRDGDKLAVTYSGIPETLIPFIFFVTFSGCVMMPVMFDLEEFGIVLMMAAPVMLAITILAFVMRQRVVEALETSNSFSVKDLGGGRFEFSAFATIDSRGPSSFVVDGPLSCSLRGGSHILPAHSNVPSSPWAPGVKAIYVYPEGAKPQEDDILQVMIHDRAARAEVLLELTDLLKTAGKR